MEQKNKENAVIDFMQMIRNSWTWARLTFQERIDFANSVDWAIKQNAILGTYKQRYQIVQALYLTFLMALGYGESDWRDKK